MSHAAHRAPTSPIAERSIAIVAWLLMPWIARPLRRRARLVLTAAAAGWLFLAGSGLAFADTLQDTIVGSSTTLNLIAGDPNSTGTATIRVIANSAGGDPDPGCNFDSSAE